MDWGSILSTCISAILMSLLMYYLNNTAQQEVPKNINGKSLLKLSKLYCYLGYTCLLIVFLAIGTTIYLQDAEAILPVLFISLLFGFLGTLCLMYHYNHWVEFDEDKIRVNSWRNKQEVFGWSQIEKIKTNSFSGNLILHLSNGRKAKIQLYIKGMKSFLETLEAQTEWKVSELKLPFRF